MKEQHELMELVRSTVLEVCEKPLPDLAPETPISQMGIDSITVAEVLTRIEDALGIEVPASEWLRARTLQDLVDAVERARNK
jgi:acyl carrier protein